jgi:hypothetical protein
MSEEKFLRALGTLYNMAIDNTKGSRAVEICVKDIQNYVQQKENIIKEVREYIEKHSQMTDLQIYGIENVLSFRGSVEKLLEILDKVD